ncbi:DUF6221 family protein [Streptomyces werraensis]|uniref:DUF6221 family protein n=1 Tax=Streptomyces werraensis TaxID=68284 RepID=UPI0036ABD100
MDELVRWLGVQLDADKARAAQWHDLECSIHEHQEGGLLKAVAALEVYGEVPGAVCDCGGPARVLREIDAGRQLLALHLPTPYQDEGDRWPGCTTCSWRDEMDDLQVRYPCKTVRLLALPYADRPGYREEWRP